MIRKRYGAVERDSAADLTTLFQLPALAAERGLDLQPSDFMKSAREADLVPAEESTLPKATNWGDLTIGNTTIPCYVLNTHDRVFSLKGVVVGLIGTEGGQLAEYLKVKALQPHLPTDLVPAENGEIPAEWAIQLLYKESN